MRSFNYQLQEYRGQSTRFTCPKCHKPHTFTRYVDQSGAYLADNVGRCNREDQCGYHYAPSQYFIDNNIKADAQPVAYVPEQIKPVSYIDESLFKASLACYESNKLFTYLSNKFTHDVAFNAFQRYNVGTSNKFDGGSSVFWQMDRKGLIRTGKIMQYNGITGHRIKEPYNMIDWVHSTLKLPEFNLKQCLFGEHLLPDNNNTVCIVESEKTAIIASICLPDYTWLAVGGKSNIKDELLRPLTGKEVIFWPDLKGFSDWSDKVSKLSVRFNRCTITRYLEDNASEEEINKGYDLADYLLMQ